MPGMQSFMKLLNQRLKTSNTAFHKLCCLIHELLIKDVAHDIQKNPLLSENIIVKLNAIPMYHRIKLYDS